MHALGYERHCDFLWKNYRLINIMAENEYEYAKEKYINVIFENNTIHVVSTEVNWHYA